MKLLFDKNLSPRLVRLAAVGYPGSVHVRDVGLKGHVDDDLWQFARRSGFTIVSKDTDFRDRSYVEGFPPKVIGLDIGNASTDVVAHMLTAELGRARQFEADGEASILISLCRRTRSNTVQPTASHAIMSAAAADGYR